MLHMHIILQTFSYKTEIEELKKYFGVYKYSKNPYYVFAWHFFHLHPYVPMK